MFVGQGHKKRLKKQQNSFSSSIKNTKEKEDVHVIENPDKYWESLYKNVDMISWHRFVIIYVIHNKTKHVQSNFARSNSDGSNTF